MNEDLRLPSIHELFHDILHQLPGTKSSYTPALTSETNLSLHSDLKYTQNKNPVSKVRKGPYQERVLTKVYDFNPYPNRDERLRLARELDLNPRVVQIWFQNKRQKDKSKRTCI